MTNEILLNGISFKQLENSISTIVANQLEVLLDKLTNSQDKEQPEFITRQQTADLLGVSLVTLHKWTKNGVIPAKKIESRVRYDRQDVLNALRDVETLKYSKPPQKSK